jgi:long-chain fatty acid transport protein
MAKATLDSKARKAMPMRCGHARNVIIVVASAMVGLCDASPGHASAFFIREQSAAALGNAFAGATAGADDITYMFFNGAVLARQEGSQVASVGTYMLSRAQFGDGEATTAGGNDIEGRGGGRNGGGQNVVPALYALWDLSDRFAVGEVDVGIAVNAPFGFETEYKEGWIGRYYALQSRIKSLALNPVVSFEPVPAFRWRWARRRNTSRQS